MKIIVTTLLLILVGQTHAQFDVDRNTYAWERTAFERWDEFRPWLYFNLFARRYRDEDRRTMAVRSQVMSLYAINADNYQVFSKSVDSIYKIETQKAIDRSLNKNYLLFQRTTHNNLTRRFNDILNMGIDVNMPQGILNNINNSFVGIDENIEFIRNSYVPDADKFPLIEEELDHLADKLKIYEQLVELYRLNYDQNGEQPLLNIQETRQTIDLEISTIIQN